MIKRRELIAVLVMAVLFAAVWLIVTKVNDANDSEQTRFVHDAVRNAALTCYAVEGAYPEDLGYLRENYGLAYDESRYIVDYDAFASNLVPEIYVMELEADAP